MLFLALQIKLLAQFMTEATAMAKAAPTETRAVAASPAAQARLVHGAPGR